RRALLRLLGCCLGGLAFPLASQGQQGAAARRAPGLLAHPGSAARLGRRFLEAHPAEADRERLLRTLGLPRNGVARVSPAQLEAHGRRLRELHREDFREARVVELGGWTLSLTELRLAALVWLDSHPKRRARTR
ncbi:MAG: hypothetical protein ACE5IL_18045, partial [Myxococcota bacterium]